MELDAVHESPAGAVRWASWGPETGEPVVFLHGTPFSSAVWWEIADALSSRHRVYVWDMPGYGRSAKHGGQDVSLAMQQEVFTSLLEHWRLAAPSVVAHDFGGTVALRAALLGGARYARLALFDAVSIRPWGSEFFRLVAGNSEVFAALPAHLHEALVRSYIGTAAHHPLPPHVLDGLLEPWRGPEGQPAFYRQIAQADERYTREFEDRFDQLDMPVLIGWGREDSWLPPERGERLAAAIRGSRLHWIPRAGHLVQHDAPAQVTALLTEFLPT